MNYAEVVGEVYKNYFFCLEFTVRDKGDFWGNLKHKAMDKWFLGTAFSPVVQVALDISP